ncbi:hypothetical protein [Streptomyces sp. NPDC093094]|uniref:hypothetical protein n=1 Tax=Streptomyces sp. NPDC093094 TaxID=3366026 RepID=UPI00380A6523
MISPDPATPVGAAVIALYRQMQDLQERTGEWPGADTAGILGQWLTGFDLRQADGPLPSGNGPQPDSFPDEAACAEFNAAAVFHPMAGPHDEGLPCIEIAGILVFAYLDPDLHALRVSVHLDTTDHRIAPPGQTVPLHIEAEDTTLHSSTAPTPAARAAT